MSLVFLLSAIPTPAADVALTPNFRGDDIMGIFGPTTSTKSEFETTAQYEARRNAAQVTGNRLVLLLDQARTELFKYDADAGMMTATLPIQKTFFITEPKEPTYNVVSVHKDVRADSYIGSNAYGAQRQIDRTRGTEYGVILTQSLKQQLVFPLTPAVAQDTKPYLHIGFACTVLDNTPLKHLTYHKPTIDSPYELSVLGYFVPVLIRKVSRV
jgi:hypothetical protein